VHGRAGRWAIVVALLAAGCHGPVPAAGAPAADDRTDVWFMQHMVPHLRQVSSIAFLNRDRITRPELARLADAIIRRDQAAIDRLQGLLALQGLSPHGHSHQKVDGRNQTDLERLSRLRGAALDLELPEVLAARERAGVAMAAAELRHGTRPEVRRLARGLLAGQRADVRQLDAWRDAWAGRA
jgi:uncharacterized protein (DUF305 family)